MALKSIRSEILHTLSDLMDNDLDRFLYQLWNTAEEPRIMASEVERKTRVQISQLLVSRCTESGALDRTLRTLREIGCNDQAQNLESRNKARLDKGNLTFRKSSSGDPEFSPSSEALSVAANQKPLRNVANQRLSRSFKNRVKTLKEVEAEAAEKLKSEGGDSSNRRQLLSCFGIQFGQYRGKSFKWLLENDLGYVAYLVGSHQMDIEKGKRTPQMDNKDALDEYATHYPEVNKEIKFFRIGQNPLGFGKKYEKETLQKLYNSNNHEKKRYVNYLRGMETSCTKGSRMELAINYILHRDKQSPASPVTYSAPTSATSTRKREYKPAAKKKRLY